MAAFGAHEARHVAVEFIHDTVACHGVQVVDVLRDDATQSAFLLPFGQDEMSGVGLDVLVAEEVIKHLTDDLPRLLGVAVVEVDVEGVGVVLVPDAALATERRDAALGGSARAGEAHDVLRLGEDFSGLLDFFFVIHNSGVFFITKLAKPDKTFLLGSGKRPTGTLSGGDAVAQPPTLNDSFVCFVGFVTWNSIIVSSMQSYTKILQDKLKMCIFAK